MVQVMQTTARSTGKRLDRVQSRKKSKNNLVHEEAGFESSLTDGG